LTHSLTHSLAVSGPARARMARAASPLPGFCRGVWSATQTGLSLFSSSPFVFAVRRPSPVRGAAFLSRIIHPPKEVPHAETKP
ncbi:hypothetical protein, partial [uncultured Desulfovibrio sp.]|uniref:hypothetical protein n=1 Tax=uncultured Desulfovibrio sp. TaxID=167968 RepID=UPI002604370D